MLTQFRRDVHVGRLLTGGGVDVEVAEEDLRVAGGRGSVLRIVVGLDVDGRGHGCLQAGEGCGLAVGAVHAVALGLGSQDHELEVRHRVRNAVQGECHRAGAEGDGSGCRGSDAGEGRGPCAFPDGIVLGPGALCIPWTLAAGPLQPGMASRACGPLVLFCCPALCKQACNGRTTKKHRSFAAMPF